MGIVMYNTLKIERFVEKKYLKFDCFMVLFFTILFVTIGLFENNLFLPNSGLGLFEHINVWIFLLSNLLVPFILNRNWKILNNNVDDDIFTKLKDIFAQNAEYQSIKVLLNFIIVIGFCFFVGNSLQNAHFINPLSFKYWDSSDYMISYIISRVYKLYLFAYFMPVTFVYTLLSIKSASELLRITDEEMEDYPIKNYMKLNALCDFGLNTLMTIIIPVLLSSGGIYLIHDKLDITTISTIIIATSSTLGLLILYIFLISKYYISVIKYKKKHIAQIDVELAEVHKNILDIKISEKNNGKLDLYLKKEEYLWKCKERIEKISKFPLVVKAIITVISPLIPTLTKIIFSALEYFF